MSSWNMCPSQKQALHMSRTLMEAHHTTRVELRQQKQALQNWHRGMIHQERHMTTQVVRHRMMMADWQGLHMMMLAHWDWELRTKRKAR